MKVFVFGSEFQGDDIAYRVARECGEHEFVFSNDPTELLEEERIVIMDAVKGIDKVTVFGSADVLNSRNVCSLHDFDLGFFLELMQKLGVERTVKIVGLPMRGDYEEILSGARTSLRDLVDSLSG
jgi:hypothetical protein